MATTIQVSEDLQKELQKRKLYNKESYEEIIWDLLEDTMELSEETKKSIAKAEEDFKTGRTKSLEQVKKESMVVIPQDLSRFYHPVGFLKEIELRDAYAAADVFISRAGSGSIFEIAALGKPSILVPLALAAQDHQVKNAYAYLDASKGATIVIEESNLTSHFLLEKIKYLFAMPGELERMSKAAKAFAKPDSGRLIAEYIMNYFKK